MLLETHSDSTANGIESVGPECNQGADIADSTQEVLYWKKASKESPIATILEEMTGLLSHAVSSYSREMVKQVDSLKRF